MKLIWLKIKQHNTIQSEKKIVNFGITPSKSKPTIYDSIFHSMNQNNIIK